jgi:diguanylate cyclase (GGDEF)-like protein
MTLPRVANSLASRIILIGITVVVLASVLRYFVFSSYLREDITAVMAAQQLTLANYVARDIENKMQERQGLLKQIAATLPVSLLDHPAQLREWLATRHALQSFFSEGFMVTSLEGRLLADYPQRAERANTDFSDREHIRLARNGDLNIGSPVLGRAAHKPILPMSAPVRDASGRVRAVLTGATALDGVGFLSFNPRERIGDGGGFLLISPRDRLFVASTEPGMVLRPTPADGVNHLHDRAMQGFRGTGVTVNAKGVEEISAIASVPSTGWFVVARIPTSEALSVVTRTQSFIARASVLSVVVFVLLATAGLIYVFRPLLHAADHADRMTRGEAPLEPLAVVRQDEVGHLTEAFNRLLLKLQSSQAEMLHMAHHDVLTGLPNRALLGDRLAQALARANRHHTWVALLYVDLDRFKPINDRLGHQAGDAALKQIAQRLSAVVRESDTLARVGGDEFVLLLADLEGPQEQVRVAASAVAAKCLDAIETPINLGGELHAIGASIGIALGDGTLSSHDLQVAADSAMYKAKQAGGQRFFVTTAHDARVPTPETKEA